MKNSGLNFKNILEVILKTINKNANILAYSYLIKDASTISKWKSKKLTPRNEDIIKIVEFAMVESTGTQRKIMRDKIEYLVANSQMKENIKMSLLRIEDFQEFLNETLRISVLANTQSNSDEAPMDSDSRLKGKISGDELSGFSFDNVDGKYAGVVEFNLTLKKDTAKKDTDQPETTGIIEKNNIRCDITGKIDCVHKRIIGNGFIGITIMALVSFFFVLYAINNTQATVTDSLKKGLKVYAYNKERAAATTISSCTPEPNQTCMPTQKLEFVNRPGIAGTPLPTFVYKDSKEPLNQADSTKAQTSASGTDNNNNSSCDIAVNGNNNQIIQNSNVFFDIEK